MGQQLRELPEHVLLHLDGGVTQQGLQSLQVRALRQDRLERALRLGLQVLAGLLVHHAGQQVSEHVALGERPGVVRCVAADLAQGPRTGGLDVVLRLRHQRVLQRRDGLGDNHGQREGLGESSDVSDSHDSGQLVVAVSLEDVVHQGRRAAGVDDQLGQLGRVLGDLADAHGSVLAHHGVTVLEAVQDVGEDLGLHHHLGEVNGVLGDVGERAAHLALQLRVGVKDERGQVGHGAGVYHGLGELGGVLADVAHRGGGDALQGDLGLLDAQHQQGNRSGVHHVLRQPC